MPGRRTVVHQPVPDGTACGIEPKHVRGSVAVEVRRWECVRIKGNRGLRSRLTCNKFVCRIVASEVEGGDQGVGAILDRQYATASLPGGVERGLVCDVGKV